MPQNALKVISLALESLYFDIENLVLSRVAGSSMRQDSLLKRVSEE